MVRTLGARATSVGPSIEECNVLWPLTPGAKSAGPSAAVVNLAVNCLVKFGLSPSPLLGSIWFHGACSKLPGT